MLLPTAILIAISPNDLHLPLTMPGYLYLTHLRSLDPQDPYHVRGAVLPGSPFVISGHNDHIAWGMALSYADSGDLYIEQLSAEQTHYQVGAAQRP